MLPTFDDRWYLEPEDAETEAEYWERVLAAEENAERRREDREDFDRFQGDANV